jgi:hypothetical protein
MNHWTGLWGRQELRRSHPIRHRFGGLNGRVLARSVPSVWTTANAAHARGIENIAEKALPEKRSGGNP